MTKNVKPPPFIVLLLVAVLTELGFWQVFFVSINIYAIATFSVLPKADATLYRVERRISSAWFSILETTLYEDFPGRNINLLKEQRFEKPIELQRNFALTAVARCSRGNSSSSSFLEAATLRVVRHACPEPFD